MLSHGRLHRRAEIELLLLLDLIHDVIHAGFEHLLFLLQLANVLLELAALTFKILAFLLFFSKTAILAFKTSLK